GGGKAQFERGGMLAPQIPREAYQRTFVEAIHENFWAYGVCATREPILMWTHYADGHKGIALHFNPRVTPFDRVFTVHYHGRYPEHPFPAFESVATSGASRAMLYTKAAGWAYEEERRVIRVVAAGTPE